MQPHAGPGVDLAHNNLVTAAEYKPLATYIEGVDGKVAGVSDQVVHQGLKKAHYPSCLLDGGGPQVDPLVVEGAERGEGVSGVGGHADAPRGGRGGDDAVDEGG